MLELVDILNDLDGAWGDRMAFQIRDTTVMLDDIHRGMCVASVLASRAGQVPPLIHVNLVDEGAQSTMRFDAKPPPALNEATLLTTADLLGSLPTGEREQSRAYLSHRIGEFLAQTDLPTRLVMPMHAFAPQPGGGDGTECGRLCWRSTLARQRDGDFAACQPLDSLVSLADPRNGGKCASDGYLQVK